MDPEEVKAYYSKQEVVFHYALSVNRVGLWRSEEILLTRLFSPSQKILELGCGAGRISFGLHALGYHFLKPTDYSQNMVEMARTIAEEKRVDLAFDVADACNLQGMEDGSFEGAIFGFNGLMQIPQQLRRLLAMKEIARVLKPGSHFFFTTHDRTNPKHRRLWKRDLKQWRKGEQPKEYDQFGDCIGETQWGEMYIHVPIREEIEAQLVEAGFRLLSCEKRSTIALEDQATREFSDECLMWVATKK